MRKKFTLMFLGLLSYSASHFAFAADLMEVYRQALCSDQTFKQIVSTQLANKQGVPISFAAILPALSGTVTPQVTKTNVSGLTGTTGSSTVKGVVSTVNLTQTIFNFSQFANVSQNYSLSKQADATINSAAQDLMLRVAKAYFAILQDEDNERSLLASKQAFAKQLDQVTQQYNVGLKTITDVYTAQASYDSSVASYIAAQTKTANDRENLRVITGVYYRNLSKLSTDYPLVTPNPANVEAWVVVAQRQNWSIKAAQYAADAACKNIQKQFGGHIPNLQAQGFLTNQYLRTIAEPGQIVEDIPAIPVSGGTRTTQMGASLAINIPLVQGGLVIANTRQAKYSYSASYHNLEQQVRNTINQARQSYLNVISGISQVHADKLTIKSTISSLEGLKAGYQIGTQTLVDVVNQQQNVVRAEFQYAADRYSYVNNLLTLKFAAGTLSPCDLENINTWLYGSAEHVGLGDSDLQFTLPSTDVMPVNPPLLPSTDVMPAPLPPLSQNNHKKTPEKLLAKK